MGDVCGTRYSIVRKDTGERRNSILPEITLGNGHDLKTDMKIDVTFSECSWGPFWYGGGGGLLSPNLTYTKK
jgi:hypothetical protein